MDNDKEARIRHMLRAGKRFGALMGLELTGFDPSYAFRDIETGRGVDIPAFLVERAVKHLRGVPRIKVSRRLKCQDVMEEEDRYRGYNPFK